MFDLAPIGITTDGSGGAHHPEQQKHDGCRKGRHDDVWERAKSVFGDEEEKREKKRVVFCLQRNLIL